MATTRRHYERAVERYLRRRNAPFLSVDDARRAVLPPGARLTVRVGQRVPEAGGSQWTLKSFDYVVYTGLTPDASSAGRPVIIDVKGRKAGRASKRPRRARPGPPTFGRLESWVTRDDVTSMSRWLELFGGEFDAAFLFAYWLEDRPPDGLMADVVFFEERWYAMRAVRVADYREAMVTRSPRWGTVHLPAAEFERLAIPFAPPPARVARAAS